MNRPLILISNDDGIGAAGVHRLVEWLSPMSDIVCVCPDGPRSAQSMAITVNTPLRVERQSDYAGARMYKVNGTPVDCIKLSMHRVLERRPDLVVAGINHGSNAAVNVVYSGTMGAVMEGCIFGIPSIGYSLCNHAADADFSHCRIWIEKITAATLAHGLPAGVCLNVNFPKVPAPAGEIRLVRAARGKWSDEYAEYVDPHGRPYYWLTGRFENEEPDAVDTDEWCLSHGIVSVVPTSLDRTAPLSGLDWLSALR